MGRRIGDPATLGYAVAGYIAANHSPEFTPRQLTLGTDQLQLAMEAGDLERAAEAHEHRLTALIELGDIQAAKAELAALTKLAEELRQPSQDWFVAVYRALLALLQGEFAEAEDLTRARPTPGQARPELERRRLLRAPAIRAPARAGEARGGR